MKYCKYLISIHAAREGGDGLSGYFALLCLEFQSTPPVKAATCTVCALICSFFYFNPRRP